MWKLRAGGLAGLLLLVLAVSAGPASPAAPYRVALPVVLSQDRAYWGIQPWPYDRLTEPAFGAALTATGAGWVRARMQWFEMEPVNTTPDKYRYDWYDAHWGAAARLGLQVIVTLEDAPTWAARTYRGPLNPGMQQEWLEWVEAVVSRYSKPPYNIHFWEVYNEPDGNEIADTVHAVGGWGNHPLEFADLLKATYPVIKRADPQGQVLISLSYDWFTDDPGASAGVFERDFLDRLLDPQQGNAASAFDVFGVHMYTFFRTRWDPYGPDLIGKTNYLRGVMAKYGVQKPMIVSEMGAASAVDGTPETQARYAIKGTVRGLAAGHSIVIWMPLLDYNYTNRGAIYNDDLTPRPAVAAFRTLINELRNPSYLEDLRQRQPVAPAVEGYFFGSSLGETLVVWLDTDASLSQAVELPVTRLRAVDRAGTARVIADGDDGAIDGAVTLVVTTEPLIIRSLDGRPLRRV